MMAMGVVGLMLISGSSVADTRPVEDERDTSQRVDPIEATHGHHDSLRGVLVHTVQMAEPWAEGDLLGMELQMWLGDGDASVDRLVHVGFNPDGTMYGLVDNERGRTIGYANVWKPDDQTVRLDLPRELVSRGARSYRWALTVSFACDAPEGAPCMPAKDRIPNQGKVRHRI